MKPFTKIIASVFLLTIISSCTDKDVLEPKVEPVAAKKIGDNYGGGIIFYVDASGQHGLIGAPDDIFWNIPRFENWTAVTSSFTFQVTGITGTVGTQLKSVNFSVSHASASDLVIKLQAPNASIIDLVGNNLNSGSNFTNTTIKTGFPSTNSASPPYTGTYSPDQPFSNLSSSTANGVWKVVIYNYSNINYGELTSCSVTFNSTVFPVTINKSKTWDNGVNYTTYATAAAIYGGNDNTTNIISYCGNGAYAAKLCSDYENGGYSDWYLPSIDELTELYNQRSLFPTLNTSGFYYWSSTEISSTTARRKIFSTGATVSSAKSSLSYVRAIRKF